MATAPLALQKAIKDRLAANKSISALIASEFFTKQGLLSGSANLVIVGKGIILRRQKADEATPVQLDVNVWMPASQIDMAKAAAHTVRQTLNDAMPWSFDHWRTSEMKQTIRLSHEQLAGESFAHGLVSIDALLMRSN